MSVKHGFLWTLRSVNPTSKRNLKGSPLSSGDARIDRHPYENLQDIEQLPQLNWPSNSTTNNLLCTLVSSHPNSEVVLAVAASQSSCINDNPHHPLIFISPVLSPKPVSTVIPQTECTQWKDSCRYSFRKLWVQQFNRARLEDKREFLVSGLHHNTLPPPSCRLAEWPSPRELATVNHQH